MNLKVGPRFLAYRCLWFGSPGSPFLGFVQGWALYEAWRAIPPVVRPRGPTHSARRPHCLERRRRRFECDSGVVFRLLSWQGCRIVKMLRFAPG